MQLIASDQYQGDTEQKKELYKSMILSLSPHVSKRHGLYLPISTPKSKTDLYYFSFYWKGVVVTVSWEVALIAASRVVV